MSDEFFKNCRISLTILQSPTWNLTEGTKRRHISRWLLAPGLDQVSFIPIGQTWLRGPSLLRIQRTQELSAGIGLKPLAMLGAHKTDPKIQIPGELLKDTQILGPLGLTKLFRGPCIYPGHSWDPRMRSHLGNVCPGIPSRKEGVRRAHWSDDAEAALSMPHEDPACLGAWPARQGLKLKV